jgi:hypothetical protein
MTLLLTLALAKSKVHAKRPGRTRERTPSGRGNRNEVAVVGSSCTWKRDELDHFKATIERNVDVRKMIPEKFLDRVEKFERYGKCIYPGGRMS